METLKMKTYKIKYLQKYEIDEVEARSPKEALKKLLNPVFFEAVEIKRQNNKKCKYCNEKATRFNHANHNDGKFENLCEKHYEIQQEK